MLTHLKKRFWTETGVLDLPNGFGVHLDGRAIKTPKAAPFVVPTHGLAAAIAAEWAAQGEEIAPLSMPLLRLSNSALDGLEGLAGDTVDVLAAYVETDLVCYRAGSPKGLVAAQSQAWDPVVAWLRDNHGVALTLAEGVMPVAQPDKALAFAREWLTGLDPFSLMALHDMITRSGSFCLALGVADGFLGPEDAFARGYVDETWQQQEWGADQEAQELLEAKRADFLAAARLLKLLKD